MAFDYLNLSRATDFSNFWQRGLYRFFEIIPGLLSWATLLFGFILSWSMPFIVAIFIIVFDLYWLLRVLYLAAHQISSYQKMKQNITIDWLAKLQKENPYEWENIYHLIILPFAGEGKAVVSATLKSLTAINYPKNKIIILMALEDNPNARAVLKEIEPLYKSQFFAFGRLSILKIFPVNFPAKALMLIGLLAKLKKNIYLLPIFQ